MDSPTLHILDGTEQGRTIDLEKSPFTVGRGKGLDLTLRDDTVSRQHARFFDRDGAWHVVDLHSTHGTWVNEQKITRQELHAGDEVRLGKTRVRFQIAEAAEAVPTAERSGLTAEGEDPFAEEEHSAPPQRVAPAAPAPAGRAESASARQGGVGSLYRPVRGDGTAKTHRPFLNQDLDQHPTWVRLGAAVLAVVVALSLGYGAMKLIRGGGVSDDAPTLEEQENQGPNRPTRRPQ